MLPNAMLPKNAASGRRRARSRAGRTGASRGGMEVSLQDVPLQKDTVIVLRIVASERVVGVLAALAHLPAQ